MSKTKFKELHRLARIGNLGTLTFTAGDLYHWFLTEVYDLRFPHVGDGRHGHLPWTFDPLRVSTADRLKWKRQRDYVAGIKLCCRCKSMHHQNAECF